MSAHTKLLLVSVVLGALFMVLVASLIPLALRALGEMGADIQTGYEQARREAGAK